MATEHQAAKRDWAAAPEMARETVRYPTHDLKAKRDNIWITVCAAALVLPAQVPVLGADPSDLFCVNCGNLVAATADQMKLARAAAKAEGFVEQTVGEPPVLPGTLSPAVRTGLYWAYRLITMSPSDRGYDDACKAVSKVSSEMRALELYSEVTLTPKGHVIAALIAEPPVPEALSRTDGARAPLKLKRQKRGSLIEQIVPRCGTASCWSPLRRDGTCVCEYIERDPARLEDLARQWAIVDERAPEKPKRERKTKSAEVSA